MNQEIPDIRNARLLYDAATVEATIARMAEEITASLHAKNPIVMCVMIGGLIFSGRLLAQLAFPLQIDYVHASRYHDGRNGKELIWHRPPQLTLRNRCILLLDDILDQGITLAAIIDYCQAAGAHEVLTAVLADKQCPTKSGSPADFVGLTVPDRYVFGCGMDYHHYYRNKDAIYALPKHE